MGGSARFWDKIAEKYSRQPIADEASYQRKLQTTREFFTPESEVLEIGCGTGSTAILHAPHVRHIRAIDVSPRMIEIAQRKADAENITNVSFEAIEIDALNVPDQSLDMILAMSILHLVEDRKAVIASAYRMLKPGGYFISSTACLADGMKFIKYIEPIGKLLGFMPMVKVFSARELETDVREAGFDIKENWCPGTNKAVFIVARKPA